MSGWIDCKKKLPDEMVNVLVYFSSGSIRISEITGLNGKQFSFESIYGPASHWMPLPEPPEGVTA